MLKALELNRRRIPVPVPVRTLAQAISWLEATLLEPDHSITRIEVDGEALDLNHLPMDLSFSPQSRLIIQADSPVELALQTLDAMRNLSGVLERGLKNVAVACWQTSPREVPLDLPPVVDDIQLLVNLLFHTLDLLAEKIRAEKLHALTADMERAAKQLQQAVEQADWKATARILLQQIGEVLVTLTDELATTQKDLFDWQLAKVQSGC